MEGSWDEKVVFLAALALPPGERDSYLELACPDDLRRKRIEALLQAHERGQFDPFGGAANILNSSSPRQIDEFRIIQRIGEGGMGVVYLAEDMLLGRRVALKVLAAHLVGSEAALGEFKDEARAAAAINHPAIVPVYKFGYNGDYHYLVSEYVEGPTLASVIQAERDRRTTASGTREIRAWHRRGAEIVAVIADALDASHRAGIVHRDVKPSNILVDRIRGPRLTDFGIAKHFDQSVSGRSTGVIGSCHYMSPEQASAASSGVDPRSDVFSLGVVLYELLTLKRPFEGSDVHQVLRAVIECRPRDLRIVDARIPRDLQTICHKAIERERDRRYSTAAHLEADLRCFLASRPILARSPTLVRRATVWIRRWSVAIATISILATFGVTIWYLSAREQMAHDESMAWLSVDSGGVECQVITEKYDDDSLMLGKPARDLGHTPIAAIKLPLGQYRLTAIRSADGAFCEFNLILLDRGSASGKRVLVIDPSERYPSTSATGPREALGRVLVGVLHAPRQEDDQMRLIAAGSYNLSRGSNAGPPLSPAVVLPSFWIDTRKVSNREYQEFLAATGFQRPRFWSEQDPGDILDLPIVGITIEEAEAYARWRGKRLPTLQEWQAAARGPAGRLFPGGDAPPQSAEPELALREAAANPDLTQQLRLYRERVIAVGIDELPIDGIAQMHSNVRELCGSISITNRANYVVGRTWFDPIRERSLARVDQAPIAYPSPQHGFRCAASASASRAE